jgi:hypothetical protein
LVLLVLGAVGLWMTQHELEAGDTYSVKIAFVAPLTLLIALDFLIHAPKMPMHNLTLRDSLYLVLGTAAGILNLDRFGFFEPGSVVKTALLGGLALAAMVLVILLLRATTEA